MNPCQFLTFSQSAMYTYIQNILHDKYIIYLSRESILIHTIQCSVVTKVKTKKKKGWNLAASCFNCIRIYKIVSPPQVLRGRNM